MSNPYENLPGTAFWRSAVAEKSAFAIDDLWVPRFSFQKEHKVVTFGSCFAQHFSRALTKNGFSWFDAEPAPEFASESTRSRFNYGVFSARTGNIYTAASLRQWIEWALGNTSPPGEAWEYQGRFYDPFRPAIEPAGFVSVEELVASRNVALEALRRAIGESSRFVFTMGLTEGWVNKSDGYNYAVCPGTVAGEFDSSKHEFKNYTFREIYKDMDAAIRLLRRANSRIRILLTVSPVPLTATASGQHVLVATTYSKSVLRAVAGELVAASSSVDYFPSYEIISTTPFRGMFFAPNGRSVTSYGVDFVMKSFFECLARKFPQKPGSRQNPSVAPPLAKSKPATDDDDVVCEEALLEAFGE
jgi:hypothetical protein